MEKLIFAILYFIGFFAVVYLPSFILLLWDSWREKRFGINKEENIW